MTATEKEPLNQTGSDRMKYIPLFLYSFRWNIETSYYDQKTFWSLCSYMVRSCKGIEMLVNLINIWYCAMKILPYQDELLKMDIATGLGGVATKYPQILYIILHSYTTLLRN